jgi:hypothetical protein
MIPAGTQALSNSRIAFHHELNFPAAQYYSKIL